MGLDQYLYASVKADEAMTETIEQHLEQADLAEEMEADSYLYVSGWMWSGVDGLPGRSPDSLYIALNDLLKVTPHRGSPHFQVCRDSENGGFWVEPCIYYWRKANEIHRWFVEQCGGGVDECQKIPVHPEQIGDLLERCAKVTADRSLAAVLLPTQAGFFFGSTDYDQYYFDSLKETATRLPEQIAPLVPLSPAIYYQSSW